MDWKSAIKEERAALMRLVALLFALADLAEMASGRSQAVRGFVLWLLRRAEPIAWEFVTGEPVAISVLVSRSGDSPADAKWLALRFRDLACELDAQAKFAFAVHDDEEEAEPQLFGARRTRDTGGFLTFLHGLVFTIFARQTAYATGPPAVLMPAASLAR